MTPQEAYNKGLDIAENDAYDKINKALNGIDDTPFNNPQMEAIRQNIISLASTTVKPDRDYNFVLDFLNGNDIDHQKLSNIEISILEILKFCKGLTGPTTKSKASVKAKCFLSQLRVDIINNHDKLS